jgi:tetrahydromethanopterin S-methyltransferase subunit G
MHRGTNPWPAFVDLFSALLIAAFAGFTMLSGAYQHEVENCKKRLEVYIARTKELEEIRRKADAIADQLKEFLDSEVIKHIVRRCGDDICIDLYIHFALNKDTIEDASELGELENVCKIIKNGLDRLPVANRKDIELVIEGHTDVSCSRSCATDGVGIGGGPLPAKGEAPMAGRNAGGCRGDDGRPWCGGGRRAGGVAWRVRIRLGMEGECVGGRGGNGPPSSGYGVAGGCGG